MTATDVGGRRTWTFAAGHMPDRSTGREPDFTSRDELCVLNPGDADARLELSIYHHDRDPVGPYVVDVGARRVYCVWINDLIDPQAVPLGMPYGLVVASNVAIVAQLRHLDTRQAALGVSITSGFPGPP